MPTPITINALLTSVSKQLTAVSDTAMLDAEVLLCHCLHKPRSFLRAWPEQVLTDEQLQRYQALIEQRLQGMPVAYLTGSREFWSREFKVTSDVLIPRPDTELLIELALQHLPKNAPCSVLDLGTGSGIIAITLAAERPLANVMATDLSLGALVVARENAERLQVSNVQFLQSDWFSQVTQREFDLIVSNPPYIAKDDPHLQQGDVRFEPDTALIAEDAGLRDIQNIADVARQYLCNGGYLLVEHGYDQQQAVQAIFKRLNYQNIATHTDLSQNPRATLGQWYLL
jgi:release factor glutamine methyltransferase